MNALFVVAQLLLTSPDGGAAPIQFPAAEVKFAEAPNLPKGTKVALLEGDPKSNGLFTMRLQVAPGFKIPLHTHPNDERVTVLSGSITVKIGDKATRFPKGSFYVTPAGVQHEVSSDEGATLQMTGNGPWVVTPVKPAK